MVRKLWFEAAVAFGMALALANPTSGQVRVESGAKADERVKASEEPKDNQGAKVEVANSFRSSHIIGMRVKNKEGKDLGAIDDLVVGLNKGDIRYAALSFGGFAGFGNKLFAVPWKAMTFKFGERDRHFVFDVTEDQLKNAPGFDKNNWPNVADPKWAAGIDKHYKVEHAATEDRANQGNIVYDDGYRVSTIKGMKVRNEEGKDLGHVDELVFDMNSGKINYAALSFGSFAGLGGKLFAIPFHAFRLRQTPDDKYLVLNISEEKLRAAPGFDSNHWPNTADPNWSRDIDRYYEEFRTAAKPGERKDQ